MIASHDVIVSTSSKRGNSESLIAWGGVKLYSNHSSVTGEARDFKFGTLIYHSKSHPADEKSSLKGAWSGSGDPILNFTPHVISP